MTIPKTQSIILCILASINLYAQYLGSSEIQEKNLKNWTANSTTEYTGIYHFGESESESELILYQSDTHSIGQIKVGYWEKETSKRKLNFINLKNIKIDKNGNFYSDQHSGKFVTHLEEGTTTRYCLQINNPWTTWLKKGKYEIGTRSTLQFKEIYPGKYPSASYKILSDEDLSKLPENELKLMKNEIYARYGYIFQPRGEMEKHFNKQNWYSPMHQNVNAFLNAIEIKNIALITKKLNKKNK